MDETNDDRITARTTATSTEAGTAGTTSREHAGAKRPPTSAETASAPASTGTNSESVDSDPEFDVKEHLLEPVTDNEIQVVDILCGRDRIAHAHTGTKHYQKLVAHYRAEYQGLSTAQRMEKTQVTAKLLAQIKAYNGRFLKRHSYTNQWHIVTDQYAHHKISHALRSAIDPSKPRPKKKRKVVIVPPTQEEDDMFNALRAEQNEILKKLMAQPASDEEAEHTAWPAHWIFA